MRRLAARFAAAIPLILICICYGVAYAQDVLPPAITSATTTTTTTTPPSPTDMSSYLLGLGPIGALVWGAFTVGKVAKEGLRVTVQVDLSNADRHLLERAVEAMEERSVRRPRSAS